MQLEELDAERELSKATKGANWETLITQHHCTTRRCKNYGRTCFVERGTHYPLDQPTLKSWSKALAKNHVTVHKPPNHIYNVLVKPKETPTIQLSVSQSAVTQPTTLTQWPSYSNMANPMPFYPMAGSHSLPQYSPYSFQQAPYYGPMTPFNMVGNPTAPFGLGPGPPPPPPPAAAALPAPSSPINSNTDCFELLSDLLEWVILERPSLEARIETTRSLYLDECYDLNGLKRATPQELREIGIPIGLHKQIVDCIKPFMKSRSNLPSSTPPGSSQ